MASYHNYSLSVRKAISRQFHGLPWTAPEDVPLPSPSYGRPIDPIEEEFMCFEEDCGWISSQRATIARHCRTHGWRSTPDDREYWTDIWVQSFCLTPGKQRCFPVYVDEGPPPPDECRSAEIQAILDEVKLEYAVYQAKKEREEDERNARMYPMRNTPLTDLEITLIYQSYWLERTGWVLHLWESNLAHLAHAARLPGKDEPELEVIADAIEDCV
ncbi:hypothetical protein E4U52_000484 [Claviceps spartinae]|nr:hypothetical protein E4U52_000484 [Claviceps spartinae]